MSAVAINPALALADGWQRGFPLQPEPFATVAAPAELSSHEAIELMQSLSDQGVLARIGATVRPNTVGASTLAAMAVPAGRLSDVAAMVNAHPAVNHNYEREHALNLWFVVTAANRAGVTSTLEDIARQSGIDVLDLPLERSYHIDLGFRLTGARQKAQTPAGPVCARAVDDADQQLLQALEGGLGLVDRPYAELAARIGWSESEVLARLQSLIQRGVVSRFGCILRHRRIGYTANAMAVWDVPDAEVDRIAEKLAERDEVTLCYRRTRRPPVWRYNLFAMIHGRERDAVRGQIAEAARTTGLGQYPSAVLFSKQCFKQSAARLQPALKGVA